MITLFEWPPTRSNRAKWALEELKLSYAASTVDLMQGAQFSPAYRAIQPLGAVPAIKSDAYAMFESVAIVMQLIDENPDSGLAPLPGAPERAAYYQWCVFAAAELDSALMTYFDNALRPLEFMRPKGRPHSAEFAEIGRQDFSVRAAALSGILNANEFVLGDKFSGADIAIGHSCDMARRMSLIDDFPVLVEYYDRLRKRPAHDKVYG